MDCRTSYNSNEITVKAIENPDKPEPGAVGYTSHNPTRDEPVDRHAEPIKEASHSEDEVEKATMCLASSHIPDKTSCSSYFTTLPAIEETPG